MKLKNIFIILSILIIITGCAKDSKEPISDSYNEQPTIIEEDKTETKKEETENKEQEDAKEDDTIKEEVKTDSKKETDIKKETSNKKEETKKETSTTVSYSNNDMVAINAFEKLNTETDKLSGSSALDKAKAIFITIVDFIFYDSEINGVKFDDLTDAGKQKVLQLATSIDTKIESKFPNYKDTISTKAKAAFNKASELIKKGATNIGNFAKEKLGEENYNNLIDARDDLIKYTKKAVDIIGNFSSNLYNSAKDKLKSWYEKFRN